MATIIEDIEFADIPQAVTMTEAPIRGTKLRDLFEWFQDYAPEDYLDIEKSMVTCLFLKTGRIVPSDFSVERNTCTVKGDKVLLRTEFVLGSCPEKPSMGSAITDTIKFKRNVLPALDYYRLEVLTTKLHPIHQGGWRITIDRDFSIPDVPKCKPCCAWSTIQNFPFPYPHPKMEKLLYKPFWGDAPDVKVATLQMGAAMSALGNMDSASKSFKDFSEKMTKTIEPENLKSLLKEAFSESTSGVIPYIEGILVTIAVASGIRYYITGKSGDLKISMFAGSLCILLEGPNLIKTLTDTLYSGPSESSDLPSLQSGEEKEDSFVKGLCDQLHSVFTTYLPIDRANWRSIYMTISGFDRFKASLSSLVTFLGNLINSVSHFICKKRPIPDSLMLSGVATSYILDFCKEVDRLQMLLDTQQLELTNSTFHDVVTLKNECESMLINQKNNSVINVLSRRHKDLSNLADRLIFLQPGIAETRPEPVGILFRGCPGTTKTTWTASIGKALCDKGESVYPRPLAQEFWDGYTGQTVTVVDDFGQMKDVAGTGRSEYLDIIHMINTMPFMVNQASLENKGKVYFTSEYVLATTNMQEFQLNSIVDSGAINRRFEFVYSVRPRSGLRKSEHTAPFFTTPDWTKFEQSDIEGAAIIHADDFEFVPYDLKTGQDLPEVLSASEVVRRARAARSINVAKHTVNLENIKRIVESVNQEGDDDMSSYYDTDSETDESIYTDVDEQVMTIIHDNEGNESKYSKLKKAMRKCVDDYFDKYQTYRHVILDRGKAFGTLIYRFGKGFERKFVTGTLTDTEFFRFLHYNLCKIVNKGCKFTCDTYDIVKSTILSEDKVFARANWWLLGSSACLGSLIALISLWDVTVGELQSDNVPVAKNRAFKSLSEMKASNVPQIADVQGNDIYDVNGKQVYLSLFQKNTYYVLGSDKVAGMCTFVVDRFALFQLHFVRRLMEDVRKDPSARSGVWMLQPTLPDSARNGVGVTVGEILDGFIADDIIENRDHALVELPERIRIHKDIRDHFKDISSLKPKYDQVRRFDFQWKTKNGKNYSVVECTTGNALREHNQLLNYEEKHVAFDLYALRMPNNLGMCGSPYVEMNSKLQKGKIIGLHGAGHADFSFCSPVPIGRIKELTAHAAVDPMENQAAELQGDDPHSNKFYCVGEALPIPTNPKSDIEKSRFYGKVGEVLTYPSRLVPFMTTEGLKDPRILSLSRYNNKQHIVFNPDDIKDLIHSEIDYYRVSNTRTTPRRVYDISEAVKGLEDDKEFKSITRKTSSGYPYMLDRKLPGRFDYFGTEQEFNLDTPKFKALQQEIENDIRGILDRNEKPFSAYIDCLKDETVSKKKFDSGMSRTFSAGDLKTLIMFRQYFGDFVNSMTKNRFDNGTTIGVNPYSEDWDILAKMLLQKNGSCNAGDYSAFDTSQSSQLIFALLEIVEDHYTNSTEDERKIRRMLWRDLTTSVHISMGRIYKWDHGLPSGTYLTAIINSMINRLYHKLCFKKLTGLGSRSFWIFNEKVCLFTHGDDSVFTVTPEFSDIFSEFTLGPVMAEFGMTYTPEDKDVRGATVRRITDISFLKRNWRYCELAGRWVAPMKLGPLLDQLNWTKKEGGDTITKDKANHVSRELAMHPQHIFEKHVGLIGKLLEREYNTQLLCSNYKVSLEEVLNLVSDDYSESPMNFHKTNKRCDNDYPYKSHEDNILKASEIPSVAVEVQSDNARPRDVVDLDDAGVAVEKGQLVLNTDKFGDAYTNTSIPDISRFLSKPTVVESGSFTGTDSFTTFVTHKWYEPLQSTMYAEKMKGIYTINATLVLTLQVNATPMQQGRYILAYVANGGCSSSGKTVEWLRMHRPTITQILQLHHVEIDLATQTEVILKIPWTSAYNSYYYNPAAPDNTLPGHFFLYPYESMTTGTGSQNCAFYLWGHYEDIKLGIVGSLQADPTAVAYKKTGDLLTDEQEGKVVSKSLYAVSTIAGICAKVPVLSAMAGPLSYSLGALGMVADKLGFSKPNLIEPPCRTVRNNFPYMATSDGVDGAEPLSLTVGNHVSMDPCFYGTNLDEMSIAFFANKPSYVGSYDILSSDVKGTLITTLEVKPTLSTFDVFDGIIPLKSYGPLAFLSQMFNLYKGSLVFDLKFIRTQFHSCRIVVGYQPVDSSIEDSLNPSTLDKTDYMFRTIIDIRERTEATITVPFVCPAPWQETKESGGYTGKLHFYVLDPVKFPEAVDSKITMKVEMRGGPDIGFASPKQFKFNPMVAATLQSNPEAKPYRPTCIGDAQVPALSYNSEEAAIGEVIPSLRMLCKRGGFLLEESVSMAVTSHALLLPHASFYYKITGGLVNGDKSLVTKDFYSAFASIYALSRGGVRIRFCEVGESTNDSNVIVNMDSVNSGAGDIANVFIDKGGDVKDVIAEGGNLGSLMYNVNAPASGIVVPQYSKQLSKMNVANFITTTAFMRYDNMESTPVQVRIVDTESTNSSKYLVHRALADDGSFGNFVSIPLHYDDSA